MATIAEKRDRLPAGWQRQTASLDSYQAVVDRALAEMKEDRGTTGDPSPPGGQRLGWVEGSAGGGGVNSHQYNSQWIQDHSNGG